MSIKFTATDQWLTGTLATPQAYPLHYGFWIRVTAHPAASTYIAGLGTTLDTLAASSAAGFTEVASVDNVIGQIINDAASASNGNLALTDGYFADQWVPMMLVCEGTSAAGVTARIYVGERANTAVSSSRTTIADADEITIGRRITAGGPLGGPDGWMAEYALWSGTPSDQNIDDFMAGIDPSTINSGALLWYSSLVSDANKDAGSDSLASLTTAGTPTWEGSSVHPTIISASNKGRMLLLGVG